MDPRYQKYIRQLIKDEEKWKHQAVLLLEQKNYQDVDQHPSIIKFDNKINDLKNQLIRVDPQSQFYKSFINQSITLEKKHELKPVVQQYQKEDRWADVKIQNAIKREWNWLLKMDNFMPQYMNENLKNMPNNKGYIWKGIHYYGHLPPQEPLNTTTLFEKQNQKLFIHEYSRQYYRIYEKSDKNKPKILILEKYLKFYE